MARPKPDPEQVFPEILSAAIELIREQGFDRLTMKALAPDLGMSVGKPTISFPAKTRCSCLEIRLFRSFDLHICSRRHCKRIMSAAGLCQLPARCAFHGRDLWVF